MFIDYIVPKVSIFFFLTAMRRMPRGRAPGFIIGIAIACVLIAAGIVVIVVTIICVAVCVFRKQRGDKPQKIGKIDQCMKANYIYCTFTSW